MNDWLRRKLILEWYASLSDDDRRLLQSASLRGNQDELLSAIQQVGDKVESGRQSWLSDFGANIAGNAAYDAALWVMRKLIAK